MKIIKYILLPFVLFLDHFNYLSYLEGQRFVKEYNLYKTPIWIDKFYKNLKKGK